MIDSVFRAGKNCYHQVFLEECKFVVREKKMAERITDDIETFSDDSNREDSDEENYNEENQAQNANKKTNKNIFYQIFFYI